MIPIILKEKKEVARGTLLYVFERPKEFSFLAGQYVSIKLVKTPYSDERGNFRTFSIASPPYREDVLEFAMRRSDSAFKKNLESLEIGESIEITPATGKCVFGAPDAEKSIVFLVGGVGITPARSMLLQAAYEKRPEKFFLFDSNRCQEDAPFLEELNTLTGIDLVRVCTMTEQYLSKKPWDGEQGRITRELVKKYLTVDPRSCDFYIVGVAPFVNGMQEMLARDGIALEHIFSDNFGGSKK